MSVKTKELNNRNNLWLPGLIAGILIPLLVWGYIKKTQVTLSPEEQKIVTQWKYDPNDYKFINELTDRPLSLPAGKQSFNDITITSAEWQRLIDIAQGQDRLKVRAFNILCQMSASPKRDEILDFARNMVKKNDETDVWNGLRLLYTFRPSDWREQMKAAMNSDFASVREYAKHSLQEH